MNGNGDICVACHTKTIAAEQRFEGGPFCAPCQDFFDAMKGLRGEGCHACLHAGAPGSKEPCAGCRGDSRDSRFKPMPKRISG